MTNILVKQAGKALLTGSFALPLDLRTPAQPETLVPSNGPIYADLSSTTFAIESFFPKGQAPASGLVQANITARGTIDQPNAHVVVTGRNLMAKAAATLAPTKIDADFTLLGNQLSLKASVVQPAISPVEIAGTVPLPLKQIVHDMKIDPQSPVQLSVRVPSSSLAVVTRLVPAVRFVQGTAQASVDVAGTLGQTGAERQRRWSISPRCASPIQTCRRSMASGPICALPGTG